MALLSKSAIQTEKKIIESAATIYSGQRELMQLMDFQNKNLFEIILTPKEITSVAALAHAVLDTVIMRSTIKSYSLDFNS